MSTIDVDTTVIRGNFTGIQNLENASQASFWQIYQQVTAAAKGQPVADSFVNVLNRHKTEASQAGFLGRLYESVLIYVKAKVEWLFSGVEKVLEPMKSFQATLDRRIEQALEKFLGAEGAQIAEKIAATAAKKVV